jgi:hypothetical protein
VDRIARLEDSSPYHLLPVVGILDLLIRHDDENAVYRSLPAAGTEAPLL